MPIYEFSCEACGRQSSIFQRRIHSEVVALCPHCQSANLRRLISRFAVLRSVDDAFDDSALAGLDENDPAAMARWAHRMGEEMGDDLGSGFDDGLDELGAGGDPDDDFGGEGFAD